MVNPNFAIAQERHKRPNCYLNRSTDHLFPPFSSPFSLLPDRELGSLPWRSHETRRVVLSRPHRSRGEVGGRGAVGFRGYPGFGWRRGPVASL